MFLKTYAGKVEDLLQEYKMISNGKITIEKYDPEPDSDAEEWAQRYGLQGQQTGMFGPPLFLGIVATCGKNEAVLPSLDPRTEETLEFNITKLIYRAAHPEKPVLGIMSSLPVLGSRAPQYNMMMPQQQPQAPAWLAFQQLKDDYTVVPIQPTAEEIDTNLSTLVIVHPKELSDKTLYAIDQFVLHGGHVLAFVDPLCISEMETQPQQPQFGPPSASSTLGKLFDAWGVTFNPEKVVADLGCASPVRSQGGGVEESPVWLTLRSKNLARGDILTSQLETMMLPMAGAFSVSSSSAMTVTPLVTTSDAAGFVDAMTARMGGKVLGHAFKKESSPLSLAVRMTGKFKTAFPNGKPKDDAEAKDDKKPAEKAPASGGLKEGTSTVILVGDVDLLYDRFCVQQGEFMGMRTMQPLNDNLSFFINAIEQISGSSDMIGIRSRGRFQRPFDLVLSLEQKARLAGQSEEQALMDKLQETQQQLDALQASKDKSQRSIRSAEQKKAIAQFMTARSEIERKLKTLRKNLRKDIDTLGIEVKAVNILLMPTVVILAGIAYWIHRKKQR